MDSDPLEEYMRVIREFLEHDLRRGAKRAIDLGCGLGYFDKIISRHAAEVVGVDIDLENIGMARKYLDDMGVENVRLMTGDVLQFLDGSLKGDRIYMIATLQHIHMDRTELFRRIRESMCEPGGKIRVINNHYLSPGSAIGTPLSKSGWKDVESVYLPLVWYDDGVLLVTVTKATNGLKRLSYR